MGASALRLSRPLSPQGGGEARRGDSRGECGASSSPFAPVRGPDRAAGRGLRAPRAAAVLEESLNELLCVCYLLLCSVLARVPLPPGPLGASAPAWRSDGLLSGARESRRFHQALIFQTADSSFQFFPALYLFLSLGGLQAPQSGHWKCVLLAAS